MKRILLVLTASCTILLAEAQLKLTEKTINPGFVRAVELVLADFPYNYNHITGDLVLAQGEFEQFTSTVMLPGAETCIVGRYHSELDTTASWQALMYSNEEFDKAAEEYKQLYHQLKGCHLKMSDGSVYYLDGRYEEATDALPFVTSALDRKSVV